MVVVTDTEVLFDAWAAGLRETYGKLPMSGFPRITRPRRRANVGGLSGFSLVDPSGNWIRVTRAAAEPAAEPGAGLDAGPEHEPTETDAGAKLARAVENAVVLADSHGDLAQATKILDGALARGADAADLTTRIEALAYRAELALRAEEAEKVAAVLGRIDGETAGDGLAALPAADLGKIEQILAQLEDARSWLRRG